VPGIVLAHPWHGNYVNVLEYIFFGKLVFPKYGNIVMMLFWESHYLSLT